MIAQDVSRSSGRMPRAVGFVTAALAVASFAGVPTASHAAVLAGPVVNPTNGHAYYLLSNNVWTASQAEARTLGGDLVTINNAAENAWVYSTFANYDGVNRNLWIGLYDTDPAVNSTDRATRRTEFAWISGEPVAYTNWGSLEPNNPTSTDPATPELYGHIWNPSDAFAGRWNNFRDGTTEFSIGLFGVAEVVPEPSSLAVLTAGGLGLLRRRR